MKLYIVRHGQTDWNINGRIQGQKYNVPIVVDTLRRREPINWTQFEGIKS